MTTTNNNNDGNNNDDNNNNNNNNNNDNNNNNNTIHVFITHKSSRWMCVERASDASRSARMASCTDCCTSGRAQCDAGSLDILLYSFSTLAYLQQQQQQQQQQQMMMMMATGRSVSRRRRR